MKNNRFYTNYLIILCILFTGGVNTTLWAQKSISASAPSSVSVNSAFKYTVSGDVKGSITLNPPAGMRIVSGPSQMASYQTSSINGKMTTVTNISYTYVILAEKEGSFTIPPAVLKAGRKDYQTNEVNIQVVAAGNSGSRGGTGSASGEQTGPPPVLLKLIPSKTTLFEGEQLVVATKIFVRSRNEMHGLTSPNFEGFWVESLDPDQVAGTDVIDGVSYNSQVVKRELLTAQRKGEISIESASLDVSILNRVKRRRSAFDSFFDDPFFDDPLGSSYSRDRKMIKSNVLKINIKSLPQPSPESFNGAVGSFKVLSNLKSDSISTNEAVSLIFKIRGKGNLNLINPPKIDFPPDLEVFDPKRQVNLNHTMAGTSGSVSFEYVIIPRHNGNYRIPPVEFSFFNPSEGKYISETSGEFRFTAYGENVTESTAATGNTFFREDVKNLGQDIRYIKSDSARFIPAGGWLILKPLVYIVYAVGILFILLSLFLWRNKLRKESDILYVRNKKARKIAKNRLKKAYLLLQKEDESFYEEILKTFKGYLADRLAIHMADLSRERISTEMKVKGLDEDLQSLFWTLIDDCEYSRYSPGSSGNKNDIYKRAAECMSQIEQKI